MAMQVAVECQSWSTVYRYPCFSTLFSIEDFTKNIQPRKGLRMYFFPSNFCYFLTKFQPGLVKFFVFSVLALIPNLTDN